MQVQPEAAAAWERLGGSQTVAAATGGSTNNVAAWEALNGLQLQKGQDVASSALADKCLQLLRDGPKDNENAFKILDIWAKAIKGLVNLVLGDLKSAESDFAEINSSPEDIGLFGNTTHMPLGIFCQPTAFMKTPFRYPRQRIFLIHQF